ncbi:MAG: biotin/lipoyl-binding protein [Pirellulales bacterium]|nr:biotin/lipoyl-binding protein [Pirellulales bacterium]
MSTEQPLDPQLIEQTKQQIRSLVSEIAQLTKEEIAPEEFYGGFLDRVVSALAAVGGAVWAVNQDGQLALQYQINLKETGLPKREEAQKQHSRLLYKMLESPEGALVPPHSGGGAENEAGNPTDFLLVFGLLRTDLETAGLVEVFQRSDALPSAQKGYLKFLVQMCELAGDYLKSHQLRHFSHRQTLWTQLEDFTRVVHTSLDPREAAYTIANEGRRLIGCDRLSVAIARGRKCRIEAVSGQDVFDKRSNVIRLLGKLATAVTATGEAVWYTGDTRNLAPQVEEAVQAYVDEAHSKTVAILPLKRPELDEEDDPRKRPPPAFPIGALIVEQIEDSRVSPTLLQRVEVVNRHSATALANALEHQNLFLMPLWRAIGKTKWIIQARTLPKTLTITGAIVAVLLFLILYPAKFEMEAEGTLEPVTRQEVFAGIDGTVKQLDVDTNDAVKKDQVLAKLENLDLNVEMRKIEGELASTSEHIDSINQELQDRDISTERRYDLQGQKAEAQERRDSLVLQYDLLRKKTEELTVRSPLSGIVVTWDLKNRLRGRPVKIGQMLMKVADPKQEWQLELLMPEHRMGAVAEEQNEIAAEWRAQLKQQIEEQLRAARSEATEEELASAAAEAAEKVSDQELYDRLNTMLLENLETKVRPLLDEAPEGELRDRLTALLKEKSYTAARAEAIEIAGMLDNPERQESLEGLPPAPRRMKVSYILASDPGTERVGYVREINRSADVRGEEGNTVLIKVEIDKRDFGEENLSPGATVTAKAECGRRSIGYVYLHDVIAWIRAKIIFRYF